MNAAKYLLCPKCQVKWRQFRKDKQGNPCRVNFCRHCATALWRALPCGHEVPVMGLDFPYCGECGQSTQPVPTQAQA